MTRLSHTFAALADDTRLGIVEQLMAHGELPAGALAANTDISGPAVSRHLRVLREVGLVEQRSQGNHRLYSARPEALRAIARWTMDHRAFWEASLDRLETLLTEDPNG